MHASQLEIKAITQALEIQRKETGEVDPEETLVRALKHKKHPVRPFIQLDSAKAAWAYQVSCCSKVIRWIRAPYVDSKTGKKIDAQKYIGVPRGESKLDPSDLRQVRFERVKDYQSDKKKVAAVYSKAREEFLGLCNTYYHHQFLRPICVSVRNLFAGKHLH